MIFYFSATGNCRMIADIIAARTGDTVISIADCLKTGKTSFAAEKDERVGFVTPTYFWGLPAAVLNFLETLSLTLPENPYIYHVTAYGTTPGQSAYFFREAAEHRGITVRAAFSVRTVDTWVPVFDLRDGEKNRRITEQAALAAEHIADDVFARLHGNFVGTVLPLPLAWGVYQNYRAARKTKYFSVDETACVGCGLCASQCPDNAIAMKEGTPVFVAAECDLCLGCLHRCPKAAIRYKTKNRHGQFVNPCAFGKHPVTKA